MPTRTEAIKSFLESMTHPDLSELYTPEMEVQVNVARDGGEQITGEYQGTRWSGWSDGSQTWKNFRIPYNAWKEPSYEDREMSFSLDLHAEGIGLTGWNWAKRESHWVVFDVDSIVGHNSGLTEQQLKEVHERCLDIPWVTIRRSTSGNGYHLYVFFEKPVATSTHTEHAALAQAVLAQMSKEVGFDFQGSIDVCGGNAWVWHRKLLGSDGKGLSLVRAAQHKILAPPNWRDYIGNLNKRRYVPTPEGASKDLTNLIGSLPNTSLDDEHKRLIQFLEQSGAYFYVQPENNMLVTHTVHLKEAHERMNLKGIFDTISSGKDYGQDKNCFAFPLPGGGWVVRRFTPGTSEAACWKEDDRGYTQILFNMNPPPSHVLRKDFRSSGGSNGQTKYVVSFDDVNNFLKQIGSSTEVPEVLHNRPFEIIQDANHGTVTLRSRSRESDDLDHLEDAGWRYHRRNLEFIIYEDDFSEDQELAVNQLQVLEYDEKIRYVTNDNSARGCYFMKIASGDWALVDPFIQRQAFSTIFGRGASESGPIICKMTPWIEIHEPFKEEYPGHRHWNRNAHQYAFEPATDNLSTPTWDKVLTHLGQNLDQALAEDEWAVANSVHTGREYLFFWIASLLRYPELPLPYLFFVGVERGGKSLFHESLRLLVTGGVVEGSKALEGQFNSELLGSVLCYIEEIDLSKNKEIFDKVKKYVTQRTLSIEAKFKDIFEVPNRTHWVHCANQLSYCPIFPGDTRVVVIEVDEVPERDQVPKDEILHRLEMEGPAFLGKILQTPIPACRDRLRIPAVHTIAKGDLEEARRNPVEQMLLENCESCSGALIPLEDLLEFYNNHASRPLTAPRFASQLPRKYPRGPLRGDKKTYVGNIKWASAPDPKDDTAWFKGKTHLERRSR